MESACQVKGCKVNKKAAKHIHDDNRSHPKENNNINCSDDENNEDTGRKNNNNSKKNYKSQTTNNYNTTHNNVSNKHHHNSNSSSSTNNKINSKPVTNDVAYSKVVSSNKPTTNDIAYNKVVSNSYKGITSDLSYNKVVSNGKLTTGTSELGYNKVVSGYKTISADLPYNKVVSSNLPLTLSYPTLSTTTNNKLVSDITLSTGNVTNSLIGSGNSVTNNVISSSNLTSNIISSNNITNNLISNNTTNAIISSTINVNSSSKESENVINKDESSSLVSSNVVVNNEKQAQPQQQQQQQQQQPQQLIIKPKGDNEAQQRRAVLSFEQVCRLNDVMNEVVSIHGRGNFPTLEVRLRDLVTVVKSKLEADPSNGGAGMKVRDIRLNGGAASHVLATESQPYNDLDLIFGVELTGGRNYDKVKAAVLGSLFDLLPEGVSRKRMTTCSLKEAYVSKMVKVNNDGDRWSLISLGNSRGHRNVELKFVDTMRRQFEFSVDSFQIVLDSLLMFHENNKNLTEFTENFYPTVVGESVYGDFHEALYHLQKKLISTRHPEEIRGGGLLKYCNLLVKMYKAAQPDYIKTLERYMCSRFFIDFPDIGQQKAKLENYLWNHFVGPEEETLKYQYLMLLHSVVEESTVCLMGHERRQTLALIESLAFQVLCQEQQQRLTNHQAPTAYVYANGYYYTPVIPTACYPCVCNSWMACSS